MQGTTHLSFGTVASVLVVGLGGLGIYSGVAWHTHTIDWPQHLRLSLPVLQPAAWLALALAGGLGSVLPDIDQPGSLVTRLPQREARAVADIVGGYRRGPGSASVRLAAGTLVATGGLASALLGGTPGGLGAARRTCLFFVALLCIALFVVLRWVPPPALIALPVAIRHLLALLVAAIGTSAVLLASGGVAGIIHRLPGHHRGVTHSPPFALVLVAAALISGPLLLPALPGVGAAFSVGYLSHLGSDALTIRGIPLWWPGQHRPSLHLLPRFLRVRTGSAGEAAFNVSWLLAVPALLYLLLSR